MTVLYLSVRNWYCKHIWRRSLKYTRCAILKCHYSCMFSMLKSRKWVNKKSFVISVPWLRLSPLMHCGDLFWLAGRHAVDYLPVSLTDAVSTKFCINACHSHSTNILCRSEWNYSPWSWLKLDSIWRLRQLWVHCYSFLCSSPLAAFSRRYHRVYGELANIHRRICHAGWWATQLHYLNLIYLIGTTHKL